jgi:hypothetical protein
MGEDIQTNIKGEPETLLKLAKKFKELNAKVNNKALTQITPVLVRHPLYANLRLRFS